MMKTVIKNALIVNENRCYRGIISIVDDIIDDIIEYGDRCRGRLCDARSD